MRGSAKFVSAGQWLGVLGVLGALLYLLWPVLPQLIGRDVVSPPSTSVIPRDELDRWIKRDCAIPGSTEYYRECVRIVASRLPKLDESRRHHFGEEYSPHRYMYCRLSRDHTDWGCDLYRLQRNPNPVYWPNPKVAMPAFPEAPKESVYRSGMSSREYFEALCKAEAGEFVSRSVRGVQGIYQIRPRTFESDAALMDHYVIEDPYGYYNWEAQNPYAGYLGPKGYDYLEVPRPTSDGVGVTRYDRHGGDGSWKPAISQHPGPPTAQYGFAWRGIVRERDRENMIAGGELAIFDLHTGEILALKRGFRLGGPIRRTRSGVYWPNGLLCKGDSTKGFTTSEFVQRVLVPGPA